MMAPTFRLPRLLCLSAPLAAALLAAAPAAGADSPGAASRVSLRVHETAGRTESQDGTPTRGRFRVDFSCRTAARSVPSFGLDLDDLSFGVTLDGGRFSGTVQAAAGTVKVRVVSRGHSLSATVTGRAGAGGGTVLGRRCLAGIQEAAFESSGNFHGLRAADASVGGAAVPLALGWAGSFVSKFLDGGDLRRDDLTLTAAAVVPQTGATLPVIVPTPRRAGAVWNGRQAGLVIATGAPPGLSYTTASGRTRTIAAYDDHDDFGDAETQSSGVTVLVLPQGAVFQRAFDVAVQSPFGDQRITIRADGPRGGRAQFSREFTTPFPDPPSQLDADFHVLEVRSGVLWTWGSNSFGQVGDGTFLDPVSPEPLDSPHEVVAVGTGDGYSIAADARGAVWTWGDAGVGARAGVTAYTPRPRIVAGLSGIVALSAADGEALALDDAGGVFLWTSDRPHVTALAGPPAVSAVADGAVGAFALDADGAVWDLRADARGNRTPTKLLGLPAVSAVAAGDEIALLDLDGAVWVWSGGTGAPYFRVGLPSKATAVSAGSYYSMALLDDGTACAWSSDLELPAGIVAARVPDLDGVTNIVAGTGDKSFALDSDGFLWMWDSFDLTAGHERPVLAPRAFRAGHQPQATVPFARR